MRVYLDNCCFNRPFDDQSQARIRLETEAKLEVQQRIRDGRLELAWSYILDFENAANPFAERQQAIARWRLLAATDVEANPELLAKAEAIVSCGVRPKDALHVASAVASGCKYLLTTDDVLVRRMRGHADIRVLNPAEFIIEVAP